jgi:hypothetical protein
MGDGARMAHRQRVRKHGVSVSYVTPKGAWTALSVLVPAANQLQPG